VPLSGLLTLLVCSIFCHRVLADYGPPIAAARPLICHGPLYRLLHAAARSRVSHGSLYGLPLLLSPSPHSAMCHFYRSPHTAGGFHFVIGLLYGLPLLLPPPPHCGSKHWFWPRDWPNE
ncbi:unnamed protein product, partial [Staurois parvus]